MNESRNLNFEDPAEEGLKGSEVRVIKTFLNLIKGMYEKQVTIPHNGESQNTLSLSLERRQ